MKTLLLLPCLFVFSTSSSLAVISLGGLTGTPENGWTPLELGGRSDYLTDEQAQKDGGDIVGDQVGNLPGFFKQYDAGVNPGIADDYLGFRIRLGNDTTSHIFIGFDVEDGTNGPDGVMDFFIDVNFGNNQTNNDEIAFFETGTGANNSPSTTTVDHYSDYKTGADADFATFVDLSPVSTSTDSFVAGGGVHTPSSEDPGPPVIPADPLGGTATDLDGDGGVDYFLSFQVDMVTLSQMYQDITGNSNMLDETSEMAFIVVSSTNPNSLNQDFGGVPKDFDETQTFVQLGIATSVYTAEGTAPLPEPSAYAFLCGIFGLGFVGLRRRR